MPFKTEGSVCACPNNIEAKGAGINDNSWTLVRPSTDRNRKWLLLCCLPNFVQMALLRRKRKVQGLPMNKPMPQTLRLRLTPFCDKFNPLTRLYTVIHKSHEFPSRLTHWINRQLVSAFHKFGTDPINMAICPKLQTPCILSRKFRWSPFMAHKWHNSRYAKNK